MCGLAVFKAMHAFLAVQIRALPEMSQSAVKARVRLGCTDRLHGDIVTRNLTFNLSAELLRAKMIFSISVIRERLLSVDYVHQHHGQPLLRATFILIWICSFAPSKLETTLTLHMFQWRLGVIH